MSAQRRKRVCLLTGAGGTLGTAFCRKYSRQFDIAGVFNNTMPDVPSQLRSFVDPLHPSQRLPENDNPIYAIKADLEDDGSVEQVVDLALARFGSIDLLVNAAAVVMTSTALEIDRFTLSFEKQLRVNSLLPIRLAATVARKFWRDRPAENAGLNRNVVNVSSTSGLYIYPRTHQAAYSASKAALNFLSRHLAVEFEGLRVRVNAVAPPTFPAIVSTERVAQSIIGLDQGAMTGRILLLGPHADRLM